MLACVDEQRKHDLERKKKKTAQIMIRLKEKARKRKKRRKGTVYMTKSQSRPQLRLGKRMPWGRKITQ
jgi:hypothetical protein